MNDQEKEFENEVKATEDIAPKEEVIALGHEAPPEYATQKATINIQPEANSQEPARSQPATSGKGGPKMRWTFTRIVAIVVIAAMVAGMGFGAGYAMGGRPSAEAQAVDYNAIANTLRLSTGFSSEDEGLTTVQTADKVAPSVVAITSTIEVQDFFRTMSSEGKGSGVIYKIEDDQILVITNHHVINDAKEVVVEFFDGTSAKARLIGSDAETDIALIAISIDDLTKESLSAIKAIDIGDSDALLVGESVMAMGNALGYGRTVTVGVISALNRELHLMNGDMKLIQTDTAINPGNSGGALVNSNGALIGINTIKISDTDVEGIGFALPINHVLKIVDQLNRDGYISRPYLGVYGKDVDESMANLYELPIGVVIMDIIPGSGAEASDLAVGDVVIKMDDQKIIHMQDLIDAVSKHTVGDKVSLTIVRDGNQKKTIEITLQEKTQSQ